MLSIRPFRAPDWPEVWAMLHATFAAGETYSFAPDIGEAEARNAWIDLPQAAAASVRTGQSKRMK